MSDETFLKGQRFFSGRKREHEQTFCKSWEDWWPARRVSQFLRWLLHDNCQIHLNQWHLLRILFELKMRCAPLGRLFLPDVSASRLDVAQSRIPGNQADLCVLPHNPSSPSALLSILSPTSAASPCIITNPISAMTGYEELLQLEVQQPRVFPKKHAGGIFSKSW